MAAHLLACPSCARHIRVDEARCPFCGETCPDGFGVAPVPAPPPRGLGRARLFRFGATTVAVVGGGMALASALSCSGQTVPEPPYGVPPDCGPTTFPCTSDDAGDAEADACTAQGCSG